MKLQKSDYILFLILAALIYMPLFGYLDARAIRLWDEARLANSALEMLQNKNYLVVHYAGKPDMWSVKPPLMIWFQVICMKLFGINEIAVRLPSAIAALFTCITLLVFGMRYLKSSLFGAITVLILITSSGYVGHHVARTGDYDSLLILFTTLSCLSFFAYCYKPEKRNYLYLFFLFLTLGALTKGIAALLFTPALLIYAIWDKKLIKLITCKHTYYGLLGFIVMVASYYLLRESQNPGYLETVYNEELGGRYLKPNGPGKSHFWFYLEHLSNWQFKHWLLMVPGGMLVGILNKDQKIKKLAVFSTILVLVYFIVISVSKTQLDWYNAPMYPFLAILVSIFLLFIFYLLKNIKWINKNLTHNVVPHLFLLAVLITPYKDIIKETYKQKEYPWAKKNYEAAYFLRSAEINSIDLNGYTYLQDDYRAHITFYVNALAHNGVNIKWDEHYNATAPSLVLTEMAKAKKYIVENFNHEVIKTEGNITFYNLISKKQNADSQD